MGIRDTYARDWFRAQAAISFVYDLHRDRIDEHRIMIELLPDAADRPERIRIQAQGVTQEEIDIVKGIIERQLQEQLEVDGYSAYPEMVIRSPTGTVSGQVLISVQTWPAEDQTVEWRLNSGDWNNLPFSVETGYYETTVNSAGVANGVHDFSVRLTVDSAYVIQQAEVIVDNE